MLLTTNINIQKTLLQWSAYFIVIVLLIAIFVLAGWEFDIDFFKHPLPGTKAMNPAAAVAFIFSSVSFFLLTSSSYSRRKQNLGSFFAIAVLLIGGLKFFSIILDFNFSINTILFSEKVHEDRIGSAGAFSFMLIGAALVLLNEKTKKKAGIINFIVLLIGCVAFFSILGYLYQVKTFYGWITYIPMAIHSAICFLLLSLAILFTNADTGIMKDFTGPYAGSIAARRLIPAAIFVPVVLGYLRMIGHWTGLFTTEFGATILVISIIIVLMIIISYNVDLLNERDLQSQQIENALRESEEQIQKIFSAAPDAVVVIDEEGTIRKWNPKAENLFGWKAGEVTGKLLGDTIIPHRYRAAHKKGIKHFLKTGEGPVLDKAIEIQAINKNNTEFDVALSISPTLVNGKYLFIGFIRDITERKHAEAQIQKQKQEIQDFIDSMSTLSAKLSTDGKILMVNKIAQQASGLSMEELMQTNFTEGQWWTFDQDVHLRVRDAFKKACAGNAINYDENIFVFGQVLTINFSLIPIMKPDGSVDYIVGEGRDITAQKKAEEKIKESEHMFSTLFYKSPIMKAITEAPTGRYIEVNDAFADFFEHPKEEILGKTSLELNMLVHSEERDKILKNLQRDGFARDVETQINSKKGKTRWVSTSIDAINLNGKDCYLTAAIDITARKEAEEKIRQMNMELEKRVEEKTKETIQSEKRFRNLIENSTDIISLTDKNFKTVYRSPSAERITGWTSEERARVGYIELTHPDDRKRMETTLKEILANPEKPIAVMYRTAHKDGHYIWLEGFMTNMLHDESIKAVVANLRDVTERKQAEQALQESQQLLSAIIENSTAVIYVKSLQGQYLLVNRRFSELFHLSIDAILGKTDYDFFSKEQADAFRQMDVRTAAANHALTEEEKVPQDDGLHTYISVKSTLRDDMGKPYAIFGISTDITERKKVEEAILRAEANYREIFDNATDAIYVHEIDTGKIVEVNRRAAELTGYTKEELLSSDPNDFITGHPDYTLEKALNYIQKAATGKQQLFEWLGKKKDGSFNWFEVNLKKANIGEEERILAFFREINDRKKAQLEIQKLNESLEQKVTERTAQLESVNKELEAFSYSVSHDLRAPLRIIDGYTEMLVSDYQNELDEESKRMFTIITSNVRKMGQLIDDLLSLSQTGRKELVVFRTDMNRLVKSIIKDQLSLVDQKISIKMEKLLPAECDSNLMQQVWSNLISNAIKYSGKQDKPVIRISSYKEGTEIIYAISDNGVGFDMKYAGQLFGVFQRLHKATEFEGTGVGLALVKRIVAKHGGRVWAESEAGKGATFFFSLPRGA